MQNHLPSSFASAAAGQNLNRDTGTEWTRRDGRPTNAATLTFRRQPSLPSHSQPPVLADSAQLPAVDTSFPRHDSAMADSIAHYHPGGDAAPKYTKAQLLEIYCQLRDGTVAKKPDVSRLYMPGWAPGSTNGSSGRGGDGKTSSENHVAQNPYLCWNLGGENPTWPMGLVEKTSEEEELFSDIHSTAKQPPPNKDGNYTGGGVVNGRKTSHGGTAGGGGLGLTSPVSRAPTRRRETDSSQFGSGGLTSPTMTIGRSRDDVAFKFGRGRANEAREAETAEKPEDDASGTFTPLLNRGGGPFGGVARSSAAGSTAGLGNNMWPQPSVNTTATVGSFGNFALPTSTIGDNRFGSLQSRLAHLIPKETPETVKAQEAANNEAARPWASKPTQSPSGASRPWRARPRTDTDPFGDGGESGGSPPARGPGRVDLNLSGLRMGEQTDEGPLSPSSTNPYRSPPNDAREKSERQSTERADGLAQGLGVIGHGFGGNVYDGTDRSQTSSAGAKPYSSNNPIGGWPPSTGTPDRERLAYNGAFGSSVFSPIGDVSSPTLGPLGNMFAPGMGGGGGGVGVGVGVGRGGKLGSLFPPAMQAQMQQAQGQGQGPGPGQDQRDSLTDSLPDIGHANHLGAIGMNTLGLSSPRETDSPVRQSRGFDDYMLQSERSNPIYAPAEPQMSNAAAVAPAFSAQQPPSDQPPAPSQLPTLVMPDRMRWVYQDPSGRIQGPFTGLDMHEWFKNQFFSPNLRVKRIEDDDFEPLGHWIRRIGNMREPFLVPQLGIPHGPPAQSGPPAPSGPLSATSGAIIPPLSSVLPSYGPTLTAEQQNNLERRKQEEQMLFAQQREIAMRQQMNKFSVPGGGQQMLQHHSSAHSLQSQPSFGSVTSPMAMPPPIGPSGPSGPSLSSGPIGPAQTQDMFDQHQMAQGLPQQGEKMRGDDSAPWATTEQRMLGSAPTAPQSVGAIGTMASSQNTPKDALRRQLPRTEHLAEDVQGFKARLQEFEELRAHRLQESEEARPHQEVAQVTTAADTETMEHHLPSAGEMKEPIESVGRRRTAQEVEATSLVEQVKKTQAAIATTERHSPVSSSPTEANETVVAEPAVQLSRLQLPELKRGIPDSPEIVSASSIQPPTLAPWARDLPTESQRGPSLKEIQEAEARKVAEAERLAVAQRKRQALQKEATLREETLQKREKASTMFTTTGLATTSTWGNGPTGPVYGPWAKPSPTVAKGPSSATGMALSSQTLADIQREQEMRKQKTKEVVPVGAAKSYAALAGKAGVTPIITAPQHHQAPTTKLAGDVAGEWSTVGAGGKVKSPAGLGGQQQLQGQGGQGQGGQGQGQQGQSRVVGSVATVAKPVQTKPTPNPTTQVKDNVSEATAELTKWVRKQLSGPGGITEPDTIDNLVEAIASSSDNYLIDDITALTTLNGPWFIEEYNRRKKLALKGVIVPVDAKGLSVGASSSGRDEGVGGGWNEVAKRGNKATRDDDGLGFKVVTKEGKKGKKNGMKT